MSADFQRALAFVLKAEGGYTNHPSDRGGPTNKGILQHEYDQYRRDNGLPSADVRDILNAEVEDIYLHDYWLAGRCDRMPWPVGLAHFDACVNVGVAQAAKFLQRTVSARDDGVVGPLTLGALTSALERESPGAGRPVGPPANPVLPSPGKTRPGTAGIPSGLAQPGEQGRAAPGNWLLRSFHSLSSSSVNCFTRMPNTDRNSSVRFLSHPNPRSQA